MRRFFCFFLLALAFAALAPAGRAQTSVTGGPTGTITDVGDFTGNVSSRVNYGGGNGAVPNAPLTAVGSLFYGTTTDGGANGVGNVFSFNPSTGKITDLADFTGQLNANAGTVTGGNGGLPSGALTAAGGLLYGVAQYGGANGIGDIFSFNPASNTLTDVYDFSGYSGGSNVTPDFAVFSTTLPYSSLLPITDSQTEAVTLYGTTPYGGAGQSGDFYSLNPATGQFTELNAFTSVYNLDLYTYQGGDGAVPLGGLTQVGNFLYGVASQGGANGGGDVFSVNLSTDAILDVADFTGTNGGNPTAALLNVGSILYGVASGGGAGSDGDVFSFDPANPQNGITDLADFNGSNGSAPGTGLLAVGSTLYGTAEGGAYGFGDLFAFDMTSHALMDAADFTNTNGTSPASALVAADSTLYGTAGFGGAYGSGDIFSFIPSAPLTPATITLSASALSSTQGQPLTFTATVAPQSGTGTATGTVTFFINGTAFPAPLGGGVATVSGGSLIPGTQTVTAAYSGSATYSAASSGQLTLTISAAPASATATTVSSSLNPSAVGQAVTFTATVAPVSGSGTPTGTVTFTVDNTAQSPLPLTNGSATLTLTTLTAGSHTLTAAYTSNASAFNASTSSTFSQTVGSASGAATTTTLTSTPNPATVGQFVNFVAAVAPASGSGTPTGKVSFVVDGVAQPAVTVSASGRAGYNTNGLSVGSHAITAIYSGDGTYAASTSAAVTQVVNPAPSLTPTTTTVVSSLNPATAGQSVTFTATVTPSQGTALPTGTVTFTVDGVAQSPAALIGSQATFAVSTLAQGAHTITAAYAPASGSGFGSSTSSVLTETISTPTSGPAVLHTFPAGLQMIAFDENYAGGTDPWSAPSGQILAAPYNNTTQMYSFTTSLPLPGNGAWVSLSAATNVYDTGQAVTSAVAIPLNQGWNMIGDPFSTPLPLSSLGVQGGGQSVTGVTAAETAGLVYDALFTYSSAESNAYTTVTAASSLAPFTGYWIYAYQSGVTLTLTPP